MTGGIGSGKSLVCRFLEERGFPVYDSDSRTKALYDTDRELLQRIREKLSPYRSVDGPAADNFLLQEDGRLDRSLLSSIVFRGPRCREALAALESVVHPAVLRDFETWKTSGEVVGILDKPLFRQVADRVLLVDAPEEIRLRRAAARDGVPVEHIASRICLQQRIFADTGHGKMRPDIDFTIENTGTPEELGRKVDEFIDLNYVKVK